MRSDAYRAVSLVSRKLLPLRFLLESWGALPKLYSCLVPPAWPKYVATRYEKLIRSSELSVTASIGAVVANLGMAPETEILAAADEALYEAKNSGRNRVALSDKHLVCG